MGGINYNEPVKVVTEEIKTTKTNTKKPKTAVTYKLGNAPLPKVEKVNTGFWGWFKTLPFMKK